MENTFKVKFVLVLISQTMELLLLDGDYTPISYIVTEENMYKIRQIIQLKLRRKEYLNPSSIF